MITKSRVDVSRELKSMGNQETFALKKTRQNGKTGRRQGRSGRCGRCGKSYYIHFGTNSPATLLFTFLWTLATISEIKSEMEGDKVDNATAGSSDDKKKHAAERVLSADEKKLFDSINEGN